MALSWVIGTFPLPVFKFPTLQGESEHVLGAGRYRRQALIQGPARPEKITVWEYKQGSHRSQEQVGKGHTQRGG